MNKIIESGVEKIEQISEQASRKTADLAEVAEEVIAKTRDAAKDVAKDTAKHIGRRADAAIDKAEDLAETTGSQMRETAGAFARRARSSVESLYEQGMPRLLDDLSTVIKRHPIPAVLIGTAIGFLIARGRGRE